MSDQRLTLDETISMASKLQAAEARAVAAELISERRRQALADLENDDKRIPLRIWAECLNAKDMNDAAARELIEKAAQYDIMQRIRMTLDERLAESMTNSGMIPEEIIQASILLGALINEGFGKVKPENGFVCSLKIDDKTFISFEARYEDGEPFAKSALKWKEEADTLRTRLRESEALVERLNGSLKLAEGHLEESLSCVKCHPVGDCPTLTRIREDLVLTPAEALQGYRDEVLQQEADYCESMGDFEEAHRLRQRKGGTR
jgi:hypothetical protein